MENRRRAIRYQPDTSTVVKIDLSNSSATPADVKSFKPTVCGLAYEEASKGCGIVALVTDKLQVKDTYLIQVGELPVVAAEVRWRRPLDSTTIKIGFFYLET